MENLVKFLEEVTSKKVLSIEKIKEGRSNELYLCSLEDGLVTLRLPIKEFSILVERDFEKNNLIQLEYTDITSRLLYFDKIGVKVQKFIEGKTLLNVEDYDYKEISKLLHKLHNSKKFQNDYSFEDVLSRLEEVNIDIDNNYYSLKKIFFKEYENVKNIKIVPSHNDFQLGNIILSNNKLFLIDFEYSANNDSFYDIACFSPDFSKSIDLLNHCLENVTVDDIKHLALLRMYQTLKWYLFAKYKSKFDYVDIDFQTISKKFLEDSMSLYNTYIK